MLLLLLRGEFSTLGGLTNIRRGALFGAAICRYSMPDSLIRYFSIDQSNSFTSVIGASQTQSWSVLSSC